MNEHAQSLGRLGGLANKGKPKSESHKHALRKVLEAARNRSTLPVGVSKRIEPTIVKVKSEIPESESTIQVVGCHLCGSDGYRKGWLEGKVVWFCRRCFRA